MAGKPRTKTNRKEEIIEASASLFDRVGYHGASMQMVADAVELGKPTLYHYFRSKSEILYAIHQFLMSKLHESLAAREAEALPPDVLLTGICEDILTAIDQHPGYVRAFVEHYYELDEQHRKDIRKQRQRYLQKTVDIIDAGIKSGHYAKCDQRLAALAFLGMCNWAYQWYPREKNRKVKKTAETMSKLFLDGLVK